MSHLHSAEVHESMLARIPSVTGREICDWMKAVDDGPALLRIEEKVTYLKEAHNLPHGYAKALVHEHEMRRAARRLQ
ncbi:hypothetical protein BIV57_03620 [Mangrovactinospora gilvigrisea]|uniref:DUF4287 domain-containing protein n=1 Tax=Mangrovactinospora gilvigrisea TaxID=1428644 RepID=A0A1J7BJI1_9ACTN|nr:DUF4287 domain-containing protein [Mangrovactinospora gilvigrisea]OIV38839.1 hypothetical protein BIV57_03620 [Mangrovactinospora gilvigrisea]